MRGLSWLKDNADHDKLRIPVQGNELFTQCQRYVTDRHTNEVIS